jgi:hypothetical protein
VEDAKPKMGDPITRQAKKGNRKLAEEIQRNSRV